MATLECWVDILLPEEASLFLPDDVALPPAALFEVRVVVWKAKDVVPFDYLTNMNDLFVRVSSACQCLPCFGACLPPTA